MLLGCRMRNCKGLRVVLLGFILSFLTLVCFKTQAAFPPPGPMAGAPVTLGWSASTDPSVVGYAVYYAQAGSITSTRQDAGSALQATILNLDTATNYVFSVVAYDAEGDESEPSSLIGYSPTAV